ncbi:Sodium/hydrogen exchanger family-domain-containing protein [Pelagophyceae sp. CCMP2097]|nr:Sodium/hydrogen exchanger family-domain-containing protein [Pelagophyceae sp. CCMP2097]
MFYFAAKSRSQEAFLSVVLLTVIGMSAITESIGLSGTLGAFLAGISLSETRYRYQVEADVAPFRGMLLGLFFVTVGFSIDLRFVAARPLLVAKVVTALITLKAGTLTALSLALGIPAAASVRVGLLLAQSGEFAFVAFGLANKLRILDPLTTKVLLTASAISMAATPALSVAGTAIADRIERAQRRRGVDISLRDDKSVVMDSDAAVVVCGYGRVGKVVCELLEAKLQKYVVFDVDPKKATNARAAKKPVFFGDLSRPEVLEYFHVGSARLIVVAISEKSAANKVVVTLRRLYPNVEIIVRAADKEHQRRLNSMLKVVAMVPSLPEDSRLLSLPFAGAVLRALDYTADDVDMLLEDSRKSSLGLFEGPSLAAPAGQNFGERRARRLDENVGRGGAGRLARAARHQGPRAGARAARRRRGGGGAAAL